MMGWQAQVRDYEAQTTPIITNLCLFRLMAR
jgi:hypothetical protein